MDKRKPAARKLPSIAVRKACFLEALRHTANGAFLVTRLDYAGDYNGERSYTLSLESSGVVVSA